MESLKPLVIKDIYEFKRPQISAQELKSSSVFSTSKKYKVLFCTIFNDLQKIDYTLLV